MINNFQFSIFNFQKKGFTLVETMVAITILTLAISGAFFTANSAMVASNIARDQLTASYLAQEGIEYVRMMRDNEYLAAYNSPTHDTTNAWANFLNPITATCSTSCQFDPADNSLHICSGDGCSVLWLASTNIYTQRQATGVATQFTRTIRATPVTDKDEKIVSTVKWNFHNTQYSVTVIDHLTPWQ